MLKRIKGLTNLSAALTVNLITALTFAVLFVLIAIAIAPVQYDLTVGAIAPITITATKDVEDTITTQRLTLTAEQSVDLSYISDSSITNEVIQLVSDAFRHLQSINTTYHEGDPDNGQISVNMLWQAASAISPLSMDQEILTAVMMEDPATLQSLYARCVDLVAAALSENFTQSKEAAVAGDILSELSSYDYSSKLLSAVSVILNEYVRSNMVLDVDTIELNRQKARKEVEPVVYKRGQNIVRAGEVVTEAQLKMLDDLGMIKNHGTDFSMYVGIALMLVLLMGLAMVYLFSFERELLRNPSKIGLLSIIVILVVALSLVVRGLSTYLMPVTLGAMLTVLLIKPRLAMTISVLLSIVAGIISSAETGTFSATMYTVVQSSVFSSYLCVAIINRRPNRTGVLIAGGTAGAANMFAVYTGTLINSSNLQAAHMNAVWAAGSGVLSAVLCIGIMPVLEWMFNLDTSSKLLELSSPNQPLLRRLLLEAPGTYHHSIVVANLAEAAASAIGANGLLARVGAYYHDIGKLKRPIYFRENQQSGENPHDRTDPRVSVAILTAHPIDGVQMAQRQRLPQSILDIILQHHGDAPTLYFYDKAIKQGMEVNVEDFRYSGPRPRTKESALVMLADTVEAAVRALPDSTPESVQKLVNKLIRDKLDDGQLDESPLTFKDVNLSTNAFLTVLMGVYHQRIEYPDVKVPERFAAIEAEVVKPSAGSAQPEMEIPSAEPDALKTDADKTEGVNEA